MAQGFQAVPLPHIQMMRLQPGDVVVFTTNQHMSEQEFDEFQKRADEQSKLLFPDHEYIVVGPGVTLSVARKVEK
jgi:hypothetical protein